MSAGADIALINAAFARLRATPAVVEKLAGRIWDKAPIEGTVGHPYSTLGPSTSIPDDYDCLDGEDVTIQFDIWTKGDDGAFSTHECRTICNAFKRALHGVDLDLDGAALVSLNLDLLRILDDPAPGVIHGVVQFTGQIETP